MKEYLKEVLTTILTAVKDSHTLELTDLANRVQKDKLFSTTKHGDIVAAIKDLMSANDTVKQSTIIKTPEGKEEIMVRLIDDNLSPAPKNEHKEVTELPTSKEVLPKDKNPYKKTK